MVATNTRKRWAYLFFSYLSLYLLYGCIQEQELQPSGQPEAMEAWYNNARNMTIAKDYDKALMILDSALREPAIMANDDSKGRLFHLKGYIYRKMGNDTTALANYYYALDAYKNSTDLKPLSELLNNIGRVYKEYNDLDKALKNYKDAYAALENDPNLELKLLNNISLIYRNMGAYDQAITYYLKGLELLEKVNNNRQKAAFMNNLCVAYFFQGKFGKAEHYGLEALKIWEQENMEKKSSLPLNNLALLYKETQQWNKAVDHFQRSIQIKEKYNDPTLNNGYNNLAELHLEKKNYRKADEYLDKALALSPSNLDDRSHTLELKAAIARKQGKTELWGSYLDQVVTLKNTIHDKQMELHAISRRNLAQIAAVEEKVHISRIKHENEMQKATIIYQQLVNRWTITAIILLVMGLTTVSIQQYRVNQLRIRLEAYTKNMAHTMRNQLNGIKGYIAHSKMHLERADPPLKPKVKKTVFGFFGNINELSDSMGEVTTKFIESKKISKTKAKADIYDATSVVEPNIKAYTPHAMEKNITLKEEILSEPMVSAHGQTLIHCLGNLVSNAIKYSPEGSTVTVRLHDEDNKVYFEVLDEGPGIPEEDKHKLFKKGAKLHNLKDVVSSGMGLHYAKMDIEDMDGKIKHENRPEGGSVFTIEFLKIL